MYELWDALHEMEAGNGIRTIILRGTHYPEWRDGPYRDTDDYKK